MHTHPALLPKLDGVTLELTLRAAREEVKVEAVLAQNPSLACRADRHAFLPLISRA